MNSNLYKNPQTNQELLGKTKNKTVIIVDKDVIYQIKCKLCKLLYIGLRTRIYNQKSMRNLIQKRTQPVQLHHTQTKNSN